LARREALAGASTSLGESPLWPTAAIAGAAGLYADLPSRFIAGSSAGAFGVVRWVVPALTVLVLAALLLSLPEGRLMRNLGWATQRVHVTRRWLSLSLIAVVSAANAASIILLVHLLVNGAHANAPTLLRAAVHMWVVNVLLFALWFWQLDGGGPIERPMCPRHELDFLFPQQIEPGPRSRRPRLPRPRALARVLRARLRAARPLRAVPCGRRAWRADPLSQLPDARLGLVRAARALEEQDFMLYVPGLHHIAFAVESHADVDGVHARVGEAGGEVLHPPRFWPQYHPAYYATFFLDPDGFRLEVAGSRDARLG
jgi:hypothetical protein